MLFIEDCTEEASNSLNVMYVIIAALKEKGLLFDIAHFEAWLLRFGLRTYFH